MQIRIQRTQTYGLPSPAESVADAVGVAEKGLAAAKRKFVGVAHHEDAGNILCRDRPFTPRIEFVGEGLAGRSEIVDGGGGIVLQLRPGKGGQQGKSVGEALIEFRCE